MYSQWSPKTLCPPPFPSQFLKSSVVCCRSRRPVWRTLLSGWRRWSTIASAKWGINTYTYYSIVVLVHCVAVQLVQSRWVWIPSVSYFIPLIQASGFGTVHVTLYPLPTSHTGREYCETEGAQSNISPHLEILHLQDSQGAHTHECTQFW